MSDAVIRLNAALEGRYAIERELGWRARIPVVVLWGPCTPNQCLVYYGG